MHKIISGLIFLSIISPCVSSLHSMNIDDGVSLSIFFSGNTYYVSTSGNDTNDGLTSSTAWRTISHAASQVAAGDTVIIEPGDYGNENVKLINSGTADAPITFKARNPGTVILRGDGTGYGFRISGQKYIIIEGIKFVNYNAGISIYHEGSYITVRKCIFEENQSGGLLIWGTSSNISKCHHIFAYENQFYDYHIGQNQDYGIFFCYAKYVEASNNYFFGRHHQALSFKRHVEYGIARNNTFEGFLYTALYLGQNLDAPGDENRCYYLIAEYNVFRPANLYRAKRPIFISNVEHAVVRYNFMEGVDDIDGGWGEGIALGSYESGYSSAYPNHILIYGNVMRRMGGSTTNPGIRVYHDCGDVRVFHNTLAYCAYNLGFEKEDVIHFFNNIFYAHRKGIVREGSGKYSVYEYNIVYPDWNGKGTTDISEEPLLRGPFDNLTLKDENPQFHPNFTRAYACKLTNNSPCIDSARFLTHTISHGSGKVIKVNDASYFIDGFGLTSGDVIRVGNHIVRIIDVNYSSNTITVNESISWDEGDGVSFPYYGSAPDIGAYEYTPEDIIPPEIIDYSPIGKNVSVESDIRVKFSEKMNRTSVEKSFRIFPPTGGNFSWEDNTLIFTPENKLKYDTTYNVSIGKNAKDLSGNEILEKFGWQFTTEKEPDLIPPRIVEFYPKNGTVDVPIDSKIYVVFSENMNMSSVESPVIMIPAVIMDIFWENNKKIIITPVENLSYSTKYRVIVNRSLKDFGGNNLTGNNTFYFTTVRKPNENPVIIGHHPQNTSVIMHENEILDFRIDVDDEDILNLTYIWHLDDEKVGLNENMYRYYADYNSSGEHILEVRVVDSGQPPLSAKMAWKITVIDVNRPPEIIEYTPQTEKITVEERDKGMIEFSVDATDADGDMLFYDWYLNSMLVLNNSNTYIFRYDYRSSGNYELKVCVSDGNLSIYLIWNISVINKNRLPVINHYYPENRTIDINDSTDVIFYVNASDPDGDILKYRWYVNDDVFKNESDNSFVYTPEKGYNGTIDIKVLIDDGMGGKVEINWTVIVKCEIVESPEESTNDKFSYMLLLAFIVVVAAIISGYFILRKLRKTM